MASILPVWFHRLGSPPYFYRFATALSPWLGYPALLCIASALVWGLFFAPPDYQQGDAFRIIYVHVPSAYLSLMGYTMLAVAAGIGFIWRIRLAHVVAVSIAPLGATFTFLALVTGGIWGKPMWGTYWQWGDARLVFELLLLFQYLGYMALHAAFDETDKADRVSAILAVVGVVTVPIVHYSVEWWTTLHQGPTIAKLGDPSITMDMALPLFLMLIGATLYFGWLLLHHARSELLLREPDAQWARQVAAAGSGGP